MLSVARQSSFESKDGRGSSRMSQVGETQPNLVSLLLLQNQYNFFLEALDNSSSSIAIARRRNRISAPSFFLENQSNPTATTGLYHHERRRRTPRHGRGRRRASPGASGRLGRGQYSKIRARNARLQALWHLEDTGSVHGRGV